jgi:hypothetical protein
MVLFDDYQTLNQNDIKAIPFCLRLIRILSPCRSVRVAIYTRVHKFFTMIVNMI